MNPIHLKWSALICWGLLFASPESSAAGKVGKEGIPGEFRRGSSTWTVDAKGQVTSKIRYGVGEGAGSKRYQTALVIEFLDGQVYISKATKTVGRHPFKKRKGDATHSGHAALSRSQLRAGVARVYMTHSTSRSGPATVREFIEEAKSIAEGAMEYSGDLVYARPTKSGKKPK